MKLSETYGFNIVPPSSLVSIRDVNNIIFVDHNDWVVSIEYSNGSSKKLEKRNWDVIDLIDFLKYHQENDCIVTFKNDKNNLFYEVDEYQIFFEDYWYTLEFQSVLYRVIKLEEGKWYVAIKDKWYDDYCIVFDKWFSSEHEAKLAVRTESFFRLRNSYEGK